MRRGTQTIVSQVAAMKHMVDDFAIYARQPRPGQMQPVDLSALLLDVLALYDNLRPHVALSLADAPVVIQGEPTRLRQVFHNLLQNAVDAQADVADPALRHRACRARDDEVDAVVRRRRARVSRRRASRARSSRTSRPRPKAPGSVSPS